MLARFGLLELSGFIDAAAYQSTHSPLNFLKIKPFACLFLLKKPIFAARS